MNLVDTEGFCDVIQRQTVTCDGCPQLADLGVMEVGVTHAGGNWCFIRSLPSFGLVLVTTSGRGEVVHHGKWQEIAAETAYIMPPGAPHGYRVAADPGDWAYVWVRFDRPDRFPEIFGEGAPKVISAASYSLHQAGLGLITEASRGNDPQLSGLWCDLVQASLRHLVRKPEIDPRIARVWDLVAGRLDEAWDIETIAQAAHVSRECLRRLCQRYYGCSPRRRLTVLRLRRACELLLLTNNTLFAIACQVGFSDPFSFSKSFTREFGISPSQYRERARTSPGASGIA